MKKKPRSIKESVAIYMPSLSINVRAAKDKLSSLLDLASQGEDVVLTSDGRPKARLTACREKPRTFRVNWSLLRSIPIQTRGKTSEEIIREDRDGRP